jgi:hypothetical protein
MNRKFLWIPFLMTLMVINTAHEWLTWRRSLYQFAQLLFQ